MVTRLFFLRSLRCTGIVLLGLASSSCPCTVRNPFHQTVGKTTGLIYVSRPEVYTREHLVNERLDREAWLRKQLAEGDVQTFGYQGLADTRSFQGWLSKTEAQVDPGSVALYLAQQKQQLDAIRQGEEMANLQHSIDVALLEKQLTDVKSGATTAATPGPTPTATAVQTPVAPASNPTRPAGDQDKTYGSILDLAKALSPTASGATASPIDLFRDRLAYRNEIYAQRAENSLDDAHDLHGNTLYQLTFNATIIPEDDTSHWAMIEVRIEPNVGANDWDGLYHQWCDALSWYLTRLAWYRATVLQSPGGEAAIPAQTLAGLLVLANAELHGPEQAPSPAASPTPTPISRLTSKEFPQPGAPGEEGADLFLRLQQEVKKVGERKRVSAETAWLQLCEAYTIQDFKGLLSDYVGEITVNDATQTITVVARMKDGKTATPDGFKSELGKPQGAYAYAVTPKELVQRISEVSSMREATQVALGLSALLGGAKIGQFLEYARANEAAFQAIKRAPLVVGYSRQGFDEGDPSQEDVGNVFGWVLGPRFGLSDEGVGQLRHVVVQEPLTALVSLPSWWKEAKVKVATSWLREDATSNWEGSKIPNSERWYSIDLPGETFQITEALAPEVPRNPQPVPLSDCVLTAGQAGEILIQGNDLWRSPQVTLGAHLADSVTLLPYMHGIIARFDSVPAPSEGVTALPVRIWTSTGSAFVGRATIVKASASGVTTIQAFAASVPRVIGGQPLTLKVTEGVLPTAYQTLKMGVRPALAQNDFDWKDPSLVDPAGKEVVLDPFKLDPAPKDGTLLQVALQLRPRPGALVEEKLAAGQVVYYSTVASASIKVEPQAFEATKDRLDVTLTLPAAVAEAYPGFNANGFEVVAKCLKGSQEPPQMCGKAARQGKAFVIPISAPPKKTLGDIADKIVLELTNAGNSDLKLATSEIPAKT